MKGLNSQASSEKELILNLLCKSPEETIEAGRKIGKVLKKGDLVALFGELGAGKTTFVKGVVSAFLSEEVAKSPSFVLVNRYEVSEDFSIYHLDLYRINKDALDDIGFIEFTESGAVLVEWPERMESLLGGNQLEIRFEIIDEKRRLLAFFGGAEWKKRIENLFQQV